MSKQDARMVKQDGKYDHTSSIFYNLKILNLWRLYVYFVQIFLYNYKQQEPAQSLMDSFTVVSTIHQHNTGQISSYRAPLAICFQRSPALKYSGAKIYNNLIRITNYTCALPTFKYEIRNTLSSMSKGDVEIMLT